jgi:CRP-like cAMP-binding protein
MKQLISKTNKKRQSVLFTMDGSFTEEEYCEAISKPERSIMDNRVIVFYMIKNMNDFCEFLKKANDNIKDTLIGLSFHFKFKPIEDNTVLFNFGDDGEYFYLLVKGQVDILAPFLSERDLTKTEYIDYLISLYLYNEKALMIELLERNRRVYYISQIDVINMSLRNKNKYVKPESSSHLIDNICPKVTESKEDRRSVSIYSLYCVKTLSESSYFGDNALDLSDQKRTATVFAYSQTNLVSLKKEDYISCLQDTNLKSKKSNLTIILGSPIFDSLSPSMKKYYQKYYSNLFSIKKLDKGEHVIKEGENITNIYFIRSGNYEMTINKNILEINELIKYFGGTVEDDRTQYELLYENKKFYNFLKERKLGKVNLTKSDKYY